MHLFLYKLSTGKQFIFLLTVRNILESGVCVLNWLIVWLNLKRIYQ